MELAEGGESRTLRRA